MSGNIVLWIQIAYFIIIVSVCLKIIWDTDNATKSLGYLTVAICIPVLGVLFYFIFGNNYRKNKMYSKKLLENNELAKRLQKEIYTYTKKIYDKIDGIIAEKKSLIKLIYTDIESPIYNNNRVEILKNGEEKFEALFRDIEAAQHHIHIEYYIYENDEIGNRLCDLLIQKVKEGVDIRFIYDDFGSRSIRKTLARKMREHGIDAHAFLKITFVPFSNRINYRNHRKIVVIDGQVGYIGGINVSDKYINKGDNGAAYWRDTHLRIEGPGVHYLQYIFIGDWNFCSESKLSLNFSYFPKPDSLKIHDDSNKLIQIAASGPDSDTPTIMYSLIRAIQLAKKRVLITTPYFIPGETVLNTIIIAALSGIDVKLIVPKNSDSRFVNAAAFSYLGDLLKAGVKVYLYERGFIHAKTMVIDDSISIIGTANMDTRSFDLNFEVNAVVYDEAFSLELKKDFELDLMDCQELTMLQWDSRSNLQYLGDKTARLLSPLL